ncbi:MAG: alpha-amylase, partial [Bacteroidetes bacterium]|nr:alpha-amylase [Bacteroidota bacterium]
MTTQGQNQATLTQETSNTHWPQSVTYHIFVRSFCDGNGDGIGDLKGITARWDYLKKMGVEAILISPVFASPSYHKYDVTDYYSLSPEYGTTETFSYFVKDAHAQGFKVILDIPLNHCS